MSSTFIIIGVTAAISFMAFNNQDLKYKLMFYPWKMAENKEWYRFISSGLVHGDIGHLFFNMFTLYFFGLSAEQNLALYGGAMPEIKYWLLYFGSMALAGAYSYYKNKDNPNYMALGASGAVAGVLFSSILFDPWMTLLIFGIIPLPGILFGIGYLFYSAKMAKEARDNIGHDAHLYGAISGVIITIAYNPEKIIQIFIDNLSNPHLF